MNFLSAISNSSFLLEQLLLYNDKQRIVGPIAKVLGGLCNMIFNGVDKIFQSGTLGVTIIIFTIVIRIILLPLSYHSAKSMAKQKVIAPEMKKIQKKYEKMKDMEARQRMQAEISELQRKNGVSALSGCLPMLIQMPILLSLFTILNRVYVYIGAIGDLYTKIANVIIAIPDKQATGTLLYDVARNMPAFKKLIEKHGSFAFNYMDNAREMLSKMSDSDWAYTLAHLPQDAVAQLTPLLEQKQGIEYFLGMNLVERPMFWPIAAISVSVLIPILSGVTSWLSTYIMNKGQAAPTDDAMIMQQKMMLTVMPVMMGVLCFSFPAGLGLYWIIGNLVQIGQQYVFNKMFDPNRKSKEPEEGKYNRG